MSAVIDFLAATAEGAFKLLVIYAILRLLGFNITRTRGKHQGAR